MKEIKMIKGEMKNYNTVKQSKNWFLKLKRAQESMRQ